MEEIGSGQVNLYVVFFQIFDKFRSDWRLFDLGSGRVRSGSDQVESDLDPDGLNEFLESDRVLPPLELITEFSL
jgi:hypothetical protein